MAEVIPIAPVIAPTVSPTISPAASPVVAVGSNTTSVPTTAIQTNLGVKSDGDYGSQTTAAVKAFQTANGLVADGVFGPKTLLAYNNKYNQGSSIVSTDPIHAQAAKDSAALDAALSGFDATYQPPTTSNGNLNVTGSGSGTGGTPKVDASGNPIPDPNAATGGVDISATSTDPFISQLNTISQNSDTATKMLIQQAQSTASAAEAAATKDSENYQAGLQLMGIQSGGLAANPTITAGGINEAKSALASKISTLESAKAKAISDADTARDDNDLKTLNEKMTYVKQIEAQQKQALTDFQTNITNQTVKAAADAKAISGAVYQTMSTLDDADKEAFINAVSQKYSIPPATLVSALTDYHNTQTKTDLSIENSQKSLDKKNNPSSGTGSVSKAQITQGEQYLNSKKGADGFVDPDSYQKAYNDFLAKDGTTKAFLLAYPPKDYVNPKATTLPSYLMPAKTKASSGTFGS